MKYVNALRDANDLEKYKEAVKDLDVPSQGGFMSNNKFTNFLKNLVGGSGLESELIFQVISHLLILLRLKD